MFPKGPGLTKEDKESQRQKELKQMKAKYGLQVSPKLAAAWQKKFHPVFVYAVTQVCAFSTQSNEEVKALRNPKYKDRAESRRQTVGSEGTFQRDDAPASVHK